MLRKNTKEWVIDNSYLIEAIENADDERYFDVLEGKIELYAPQLIHYELGNVTLIKAKKNTIKETRKYFLRNLLETIKIQDCDFVSIFDLAQKHGLTFYDASYLQLAIELKIPLATYDQQLIDAAKAEKVKLVE
ncbi:MAG: type II toxin-antitoxin system VapC family toxin [bacterium]